MADEKPPDKIPWGEIQTIGCAVCEEKGGGECPSYWAMILNNSLEHPEWGSHVYACRVCSSIFALNLEEQTMEHIGDFADILLH